MNPASNPCRVNAFKGTALHAAVESEDIEHIWFFVEKGARRDIKGHLGLMPVEDVQNFNLHEMVQILRNE